MTDLESINNILDQIPAIGYGAAAVRLQELILDIREETWDAGVAQAVKMEQHWGRIEDPRDYNPWRSRD